MDWHVYFAIFLLAVVLDTWTPFAPPLYFATKVAIRVVVVLVGILWILSGLGAGPRF